MMSVPATRFVVIVVAIAALLALPVESEVFRIQRPWQSMQRAPPVFSGPFDGMVLIEYKLETRGPIDAFQGNKSKSHSEWFLVSVDESSRRNITGPLAAQGTVVAATLTATYLITVMQGASRGAYRVLWWGCPPNFTVPACAVPTDNASVHLTPAAELHDELGLTATEDATVLFSGNVFVTYCLEPEGQKMIQQVSKDVFYGSVPLQIAGVAVTPRLFAFQLAYADEQLQQHLVVSMTERTERESPSGALTTCYRPKAGESTVAYIGVDTDLFTLLPLSPVPDAFAASVLMAQSSDASGDNVTLVVIGAMNGQEVAYARLAALFNTSYDAAHYPPRVTQHALVGASPMAPRPVPPALFENFLGATQGKGLVFAVRETSCFAFRARDTDVVWRFPNRFQTLPIPFANVTDALFLHDLFLVRGDPAADPIVVKATEPGKTRCAPGDQWCWPDPNGPEPDVALCPLGMFKAARGADHCHFCPNGTYSGAPGATTCKPCAAADYCPLGTAVPWPWQALATHELGTYLFPVTGRVSSSPELALKALFIVTATRPVSLIAGSIFVAMALLAAITAVVWCCDPFARLLVVLRKCDRNNAVRYDRALQLYRPDRSALGGILTLVGYVLTVLAAVYIYVFFATYAQLGMENMFVVPLASTFEAAQEMRTDMIAMRAAADAAVYSLKTPKQRVLLEFGFPENAERTSSLNDYGDGQHAYEAALVRHYTTLTFRLSLHAPRGVNVSATNVSVAGCRTPDGDCLERLWDAPENTTALRLRIPFELQPDASVTIAFPSDIFFTALTLRVDALCDAESCPNDYVMPKPTYFERTFRLDPDACADRIITGRTEIDLALQTVVRESGKSLADSSQPDVFAFVKVMTGREATLGTRSLDEYFRDARGATAPVVHIALRDRPQYVFEHEAPLLYFPEAITGLLIALVAVNQFAALLFMCIRDSYKCSIARWRRRVQERQRELIDAEADADEAALLSTTSTTADDEQQESLLADTTASS